MSRGRPPIDAGKSCGLARALSKLGYCSRSQAQRLTKAGRVKVNGVVQRDPERRVKAREDRIEVDEHLLREEAKVYLVLNKPRGLVTTTSDEQGRETVFECLPDFAPASIASSNPSGDGPSSRGTGNSEVLPRVFPVGRLDKASEGLLLFTNDTAWAARITAPESHFDKTYHVQVDCLADSILTQRMREGVTADGDFLAAKKAQLLRHGTKNSWLEVVLDEGKNRHIRRLLAALGVSVLRLVRVAVGPVQLGNLAQGRFRQLTREEVLALASLTKPSKTASRR